ncbi:hypothetical protein VPH35_084070 [Triticum aestivum]
MSNRHYFIPVKLQYMIVHLLCPLNCVFILLIKKHLILWLARLLRVLPRVARPLRPRRVGGRCHSRRPPLRALAGGVRKALSRRCKCCPPPPQGQGEGRCLCGSSAARSEDCCVQPAQECQEVLGDD